MKRIWILAMLLVSSAAFSASGGEGGHTGCNGVGNPNSPCAEGEGGGGGGQGGQGGAGGNALSAAASKASATAIGININENSAKGGSATSSSGGNSQSVTVQGDHNQRQAPSGPSVIANATAPCRVAMGIGGSWIAGSAGITGSTLDEGCEARADSAHLEMLGYHDAALLRLCERPKIAAVLPACKTRKDAAAEGASLASAKEYPYQGSVPLY